MMWEKRHKKDFNEQRDKTQPNAGISMDAILMLILLFLLSQNNEEKK